MNKLINRSWVSIVLWGLILAAIFFTAPNIGQLIREKGQPEIPEGYSFTAAQDLLEQMDNSGGEKVFEAVMVYQDREKLSQDDLERIKDRVNQIEENKAQYGIIEILNGFTDPDLADQVMSPDGATLLAPLKIERQDRTVSDIRSDLHKLFKVDGVDLYSTGSQFIVEDFIGTVEDGVHKTETITVVLIVLILILVFRSPVAPIFNLLTVGLTFLVSRGIVFQLADKLNFTISNFTNIFLIVVLFGIGTDYIVLLLMRFKEELHRGLDKTTAIINTYKTAGKTVLLSSLTILIGFSCLFLAQFKVYQSSSAVAIGIVVLILVIFTFLPAMMSLFGKNMFWSPFPATGHAESRLWEKVSSLSTGRPYFALLFVLLFCGLIWFYSGDLSYNNLREVAKDRPSVKGFNVVAEHFGVGKALPAAILIKSDSPMDNQESLADLDEICAKVAAVEGVDRVYGVTRPRGERIQKLYVKDQAGTVSGGLTDAQKGIADIDRGLRAALEQIDGKGLDTTSADKLQTGAEDMTSNLEKINSAVGSLKKGMDGGVQASKNLADGIAGIDNSLTKLGPSLNQLQQGYTSLYQGYQTTGTGLEQLLEQTRSFKTAFDGVIAMQAQLETQHPSLALDPNFIRMKQTCLVMGDKLQDMVDGLTQLDAAMKTANSSMEKANQGLGEAQQGMTAMREGAAKLRQGSAELSSQMTAAASGQAQTSEALVQLAAGSKELAAGQSRMINGVKMMSGKSGQLTDGLSDAQEGLDQIAKGLQEAHEYFGKLAGASSADTFFIPEDEIHGADFTKSMNRYLSDDRRITEITVLLNVDPYSEDAMGVVRNVKDAVEDQLKYSSLEEAEWGISGVSQMNADLDAIADKDFRNSAAIMLVGILIVLLFVTGDFWMSLFIMLSLIAAYFIAISASGMIFERLLGLGRLSWNVPFMSFIMTIALGVDYSIFLITRHRENHGLSETESIVSAARNVGGVIFSAAIILAGTFAAMYPSGVLTLMQLSVTVILGILMLCLVFIPVFLPAMMALKSKNAKG